MNETTLTRQQEAQRAAESYRLRAVDLTREALDWLRNGEGKPVGTVGYSYDTTEAIVLLERARKFAQRANDVSDELLRGAYNAAQPEVA